MSYPTVEQGRMRKLTEEEKKRIVRALNSAKVKAHCPMCSNETLSVLDGYFTPTLQAVPAAGLIGGPTVPSAVIMCNRCGFLSQHALGALGLLSGSESSK